jgi:organic hydroperoxide reductase OsmC/OhrA
LKLEHTYNLRIIWTGNSGTGTSNYAAYERSFSIRSENKMEIVGSADTPFRGDPSKHNPEDLLLSSLSSCHMLWYLHLCADAGIVVTNYEDNPKGTLLIPGSKGGYFSTIVLNPVVFLSDISRKEEAILLHFKAHEQCFIANSLRCLVRINPIIQQATNFKGI